METLTKEELKQMNEAEHDDFVLINVLPRDSFRERHIRTSINVPVTTREFAKQVEKLAAGKDRKVVVYCADFDCDLSPKAAKKLERAGFTEVYDYEGGTSDWFGDGAA